MQLSPLYKLDTKGKIRVWSVKADGPYIVSTHGIYEGKLQETRVLCKAKNVGRANETTPEEQAALEAVSQWTDKSVKYSEIIPTSNSYIQKMTPMLAKLPGKKPYIFPVDAQPKLDGYRCLSRIDSTGDINLISRSGKSFDLPHIVKAVKGLGLSNLYVDGELYKHGHTFQQISRMVKRGDTSLEYHIYDIVTDIDGPSLEWSLRRDKLDAVMKACTEVKLKLVVTTEISSQRELDAWFKVYRKQKYEGGIDRTHNGTYKFNGRSSDLTKLKARDDSEFLVTDIIMAEKGRAAGGAIFVCANDINDETFKCSMKRQTKEDKTFDLRREIYKNKDDHIGRILTVEFHGRSEGGIPREPVAKCFRDPIDIDPNK